MSIDEQPKSTTAQTPINFFESIGSKAQGLSTAMNGETANEDEIPPVDEIESLCMNCHENVSVEITRGGRGEDIRLTDD